MPRNTAAAKRRRTIEAPRAAPRSAIAIGASFSSPSSGQPAQTSPTSIAPMGSTAAVSRITPAYGQRTVLHEARHAGGGPAQGPQQREVGLGAAGDHAPPRQ